jgi:hypothetical protein
MAANGFCSVVMYVNYELVAENGRGNNSYG